MSVNGLWLNGINFSFVKEEVRTMSKVYWVSV